MRKSQFERIRVARFERPSHSTSMSETVIPWLDDCHHLKYKMKINSTDKTKQGTERRIAMNLTQEGEWDPVFWAG